MDTEDVYVESLDLAPILAEIPDKQPACPICGAQDPERESTTPAHTAEVTHHTGEDGELLAVSVGLVEEDHNEEPVPPPTPAIGLVVLGLRRLTVGFNSGYELVVRVQCETCKHCLEREATDEEATSMAFAPDLRM